MKDFAKWIEECQFMDFPLSNKKYTWKRRTSMRRIDKIIGDLDWLVKFPELVLTCLHRHTSEHHALLLSDNKQNSVLIPSFQFSGCLAKTTHF